MFLGNWLASIVDRQEGSKGCSLRINRSLDFEEKKTTLIPLLGFVPIFMFRFFRIVYHTNTPKQTQEKKTTRPYLFTPQSQHKQTDTDTQNHFFRRFCRIPNFFHFLILRPATARSFVYFTEFFFFSSHHYLDDADPSLPTLVTLPPIVFQPYKLCSCMYPPSLQPDTLFPEKILQIVWTLC